MSTAEFRQHWRRINDSQPALLVLLTLGTLLVTVGQVWWPNWFPISTMTIVGMVGGFWLRVRSLLLLYLVIASATLYASSHRSEGIQPGSLAVLAVVLILVMLFARSREQLGVQGTTGASMLVDLRDRIRAQGRLRSGLQPGWHLESAIRSAYGEAFSGDFVVVFQDGSRAEVALVDVSGKGHRAGTRSLMLSAAYGGLLGGLPRQQFLPAANEYLLQQSWSEGFATAVHVALDQVTGQFWVASAGHPPAMHYHAGTGEWRLLEVDEALALGIMGGLDYPAQMGVLRSGDALLLYTDGMVETPGRDLDLGIDRLMGKAAALVGEGGFAGGAASIVDTIKAQDDDDRSLVLVWRD